MSNLKTLLEYLLSESSIGTGNKQDAEDVNYILNYGDSSWTEADPEDKALVANIKSASSPEQISDAINKHSLLKDEFGNRLDRLAKLIFVAMAAKTKDIEPLSENIEEEGYSGPKKYKKVVGSGKHKRTVRYGAKGYSIAPGTSKGDSYCARSYGQMKDHPSAAKDPNSPLRLSRKKWKCSGKSSRRD